MLTSRRNWASGSAVDCGAAGGAMDAPTPPAQTANSSAALRSHLRPASTEIFLRSGPGALAKHRLRFGELLDAVVEGFEILDRHRAGDRAFVIVVDRDRDVALIELGVDR